MHTDIVFLDSVLDDIDRLIASHKPERGGALLGPVGQPVVTQFLFDSDADTTEVSYVPSAALQTKVQELETRSRLLELKGILHSHPSNYPQPSQQDHVAFADSLRKAPWLGRFVVPIVTSARHEGAHRIDVKNGTMSVYVAEPGTDGLDVQEGRPRVLPLRADLRDLATFVQGDTDGAATIINLEGQNLAAGTVRCESVDLMVLFPSGYPTVAPIVLASPTSQAASLPTLGLTWSDDDTSTRALPIRWRLDSESRDRLASCLVVDVQPDVNLRSPTEPSVATSPAGLFDRLAGVTSPSLDQRSAVVVGLGSVGSYLAECLVRSGVANLTLVDGEKVEGANLSRTTYQASDIGMPKADAMVARLRAINPAVLATPIVRRVQDLATEELAALVGAADLLVAATDDQAAQRSLNMHAFHAGVPAVYPAIYAKAAGGEVLITVPKVTPCMLCTTSHRAVGDGSRQTDYGTGGLVAEPGLGADIAHVTTIAVKLALGLLEIQDEEADTSLKASTLEALRRGLTLVRVSTTPADDFFDQIMGDAIGQWAYQTAWMGVEANPDCPVCGESPIDPSAVASSGAPRVGLLRPIEANAN